MPVFTVQSVINRAAALADMHDTFVQPETWLSWFNTERMALQLFKARHGAVAQNIAFDSVTGADKYPLSTGGVTQFIALVGVWELTSSQRLRPLRFVPYADNLWQDVAGPITGPSNTVSIEDTNNDGADVATFLRFFPRDPTGTYLIAYIKAPTALTDPGQSFSEPVGLEERIVLGMARRALIKEESDTSAVEKLIREHDQIVEEYVWSRSFAQAPGVRNVDYVQRGWMSMDTFVPPSIDSWVWF